MITVFLTSITEGALNLTESAIQSNLFVEQFNGFLENLGGLRTLIVSLSGGSALILVWKVMAIIKFAKTDQFDSWLFKRIMNFVENLDAEKNVQRLEGIINIAKKIPIINNFIGEAKDTKKKFLLELEGRLYDIEAKIKSGLFEGEELVKLIEYKAKLLNEITR